MSDDLNPEERALLDDVPAPAPPAGFAAQLVAQHRGVRRPRRWVALLAAAAAVVAGAWLGGRPSGSSSGDLAASATRRTLQLGDRGVAVLEPGAALSWRVERDGATTIEQRDGDIFYRVEPGGPFVVETGVGAVRVTGTCFRVEVSPVKSNNIVSGAVGALVAVVATVTVYEGRVIAAGPNGEDRVVEAGERAELSAGSGGAAVARSAPQALTRASSPPEPARVRVSASPLPSGLTPEQLYAAHAQVTREAETLRDRVDDLEKALKTATEQGRRKHTYDLPPEELQAMADKCELRWDLVPMRDEELAFSVPDAEKLSMSEEERAAVTGLMRASQKRLNETVRALYIELTGDPSAGSLTPESMIEEVRDKTASAERKLAYQRLARERAGLPNPPSTAPASPYERLFRALTQAGDGLEADLSHELGPDVARKIRDLHNGWGSVHRSSEGCPGGE